MNAQENIGILFRNACYSQSGYSWGFLVVLKTAIFKALNAPNLNFTEHKNPWI